MPNLNLGDFWMREHDVNKRIIRTKLSGYLTLLLSHVKVSAAGNINSRFTVFNEFTCFESLLDSKDVSKGHLLI
jgi:hypothetical protein